MSVVTEIPSVSVAIGKLQELGDRMKNDDFGFKDCDVINLEKTVDAVNELENERKLKHEKLETESIKCSILRHELKHLPQKITDEIMASVSAARQLNADALKSLRDQLENMSSNIQDLETQSENLEKENIAIHPECELLRQQHEAIISQLNQKMADKAGTQITLNETRDKVRQANQNIIDLEEGMIQLKEDLIQEKTEAKKEKKKLRKATIETQVKTRQQKEQNMDKKKELDVYQEKLVDSEGRLDTLRKSLKHYETSRSMLEIDEREMSTQLEHQLKKNQELRKEGTETRTITLKEQTEFESKQNQLLNKLKTLEENIKKEKERRVQLDHEKTKLNNDLKNKERTKEGDVLYLQELDKQLQVVNRNVAEKAEEVGRLRTENASMSAESKELLELHKIVKVQLNKQLEELKEQLAKEKGERVELQNRKDEVAAALDELKSSHQQFMKNMTDAVQEGKKKHAQLSSEGLQLQKEVRESELEIATMQSNLSLAQQKYEEMFNAMQNKVDAMKAEISNMEMNIQNNEKVISEKTPGYQELQKFFSQRTVEYDGIKKSIVALKNKKSGLEDCIKRAKKDKDSIKATHENLHHDLKDHRVQVVSQIKNHGSEIKDTEQQIYLTGCQLRKIMEENKRFEEACKKLENDLADLEIQSRENEKLRAKSQTDLVNEKDEFMKMWKSDNLMQEIFASRDQGIAEAYGHLLSKAEKRENKIDKVTLKLQGELKMLSDFLNTMASGQNSAKRHTALSGVKSSKRNVQDSSVKQQDVDQSKPSKTLH